MAVVVRGDPHRYLDTFYDIETKFSSAFSRYIRIGNVKNTIKTIKQSTAKGRLGWITRNFEAKFPKIDSAHCAAYVMTG